MHIRNLYNFTLSVLMISTLAACSTPLLGGVTPAATSPSPAPTTTADLCANPLIPVKRGATWNYATTGVASNPITLSTTITDVRPDGFTAAVNLDGSINTTQEWACKPEGLLALSFGAGQTDLSLPAQGVTATLSTSGATGVTVPVNPQAGTPWTYGLDVSGDFAQGNVKAQVTGSTTTAMSVLGTESVTVPAGTFNATKIGAKTTFNVTARYLGLGLPLSVELDGTFWFAPGVGWIKSVQSGNLAGTALDSTTELQSYDIP
jgi:hypothetical protein